MEVIYQLQYDCYINAYIYLFVLYLSLYLMHRCWAWYLFGWLCFGRNGIIFRWGIPSVHVFRWYTQKRAFLAVVAIYIISPFSFISFNLSYTINEIREQLPDRRWWWIIFQSDRSRSIITEAYDSLFHWAEPPCSWEGQPYDADELLDTWYCPLTGSLFGNDDARCFSYSVSVVIKLILSI